MRLQLNWLRKFLNRPRSAAVRKPISLESQRIRKVEYKKKKKYHNKQQTLILKTMDSMENTFSCWEKTSTVWVLCNEIILLEGTRAGIKEEHHNSHSLRNRRPNKQCCFIVVSYGDGSGCTAKRSKNFGPQEHAILLLMVNPF